MERFDWVNDDCDFKGLAFDLSIAQNLTKSDLGGKTVILSADLRIRVASEHALNCLDIKSKARFLIVIVRAHSELWNRIRTLVRSLARFIRNRDQESEERHRYPLRLMSRHNLNRSFCGRLPRVNR